MRRAFTLVEIIFVLVIMAILSAGTFKAVEAIYTRSAQAKAMTELSLQSQIVLDQLSVLLYNRVPHTVIGYTPGAACDAIEALSEVRPVLEWLGSADDELLGGEYDGFVDMNASDKSTYTLATPHTTALSDPDINLVFSGAYDAGLEDVSACQGAFGWHGNESNMSYNISMGADTITITDTLKPAYIFEKYYLANTAYGVARGENIDLSSSCIAELNSSVDANTLFLFYAYHPYAVSGETFCADIAGNRAGKATILAQEVSAFTVEAVNDMIRLGIDMQRDIRGKSCGVHISKQKAVF